MLETEATMDELLVAEPVHTPSLAQNGLVAVIALVVILTIAITTTAVMFLPVLQGADALWASWMFSLWAG